MFSKHLSVSSLQFGMLVFFISLTFGHMLGMLLFPVPASEVTPDVQ